jgi:hypothetical protein
MEQDFRSNYRIHLQGRGVRQETRRSGQRVGEVFHCQHFCERGDWTAAGKYREVAVIWKKR